RVVHEDVEAAECGHRIGNGPLRPTAPRKIDLHVRGLTDPGTTSPSTGNDSRALRDELPSGLEPDPGGRARDEAGLAAQSEIHARLAYRGADDDRDGS